MTCTDVAFARPRGVDAATSGTRVANRYQIKSRAHLCRPRREPIFM